MKKEAQNNKKPNVINPDEEYFDEDEIANSEIEEGRIPTQQKSEQIGANDNTTVEGDNSSQYEDIDNDGQYLDEDEEGVDDDFSGNGEEHNENI